MRIIESSKLRILVTCLIVILFFGIVLDFSVSKVIICNVDESPYFSHDLKRILIYFLVLFSSFLFLKKKYRIVAFPFYLIWVIQFINYSNTGVFLSPLTIENLAEFSVVGKDLLVKFTFLFILSFLLFIYLLVIIPRLSIKPSWKSCLSVFLFSIAIIFFTLRSSYPVARFIESIHIVYLNNYAQIERNDGDQFHKIFKNTFKSRGLDNPVNPQNDRLNLIIIFTEGLSDRVISKELTPNLFELKQHSLVFNNYYNHTAPTFRGLRGQLISGFVRAANSDVINMSQKRLTQTFENTGESLPSIFNLMKYDTIFIGPHDSKDKLYSYMKTTGFSRLLSSDDYTEKKSSHSKLSDQKIFRFLKQTIEDEENKKNHFFVSLYNIQTHHGIIVKDKFYGDGRNDFYNKFHNFDYWLGVFVDWFNSNSISDNTVLVVTSDHSTYAVPSFEESFNFKSNSKSRFVDNIPLIVYKKGVSPQVYNAHGRNTLSLAPTVLDLLGLDNVENHFLGTSLFEDNYSDFEHISIIGSDYIRTGEKKYIDIELEPDKKNILDAFYGFSG
ncbi:LTA synthase family protein [Succinivibrio dextrinosolvens]|uniref:LTA synthase family protein n=1 Tax=Succinivibrio dextrinosolvens TaxID=83771 RepID=UPI00241D36DD|nr:sulfatase-like hydrolase/transferase [Succinivibrio dextrinosolvens]MBE6423893.1 hypothetical protein [Succinivibrio dextrinosolvens]